ncbi:MAG TPA: MFS transporter [Methylomirabilota bacterium]|jgi:MFS family permease|nr:MFS transporter [Methylomirabilota bacterium]
MTPGLPAARASWVVVGSLWLVLGVAFGLFFSFPVFFVPLVEEFRWGRGVTAGAFSLSAIVQGLLSPLVGAMVDRVGPRRVMLVGGTVLAASCLLAGRVSAVWQLYLVTGVLAAIGLCAVGWVPSGTLVAQWFAHRRGSMMGLAFSGMGVGVLVIGPLAQWLITAYGWRHAYSILGAGALVVLVPVIWFGIVETPRRPAADGESARAGTAPAGDGIGVSEALATRSFWALFFAYLCTPLAVFPVVTHQVAFAVDLGFPRLFVAGIFGLTGLMSTGGRIVFGVAADRIGRELSATLSYACTAAGTLALLALEVSPRALWLYLYAVLFGLGFGARGPIITAMASQLFPGRRFGAIYGIMSVGNGVGGALGPWFAGFIHDVTRSYRVAFLIAAAFCAAGSACFWLARPRRDGKSLSR